MTTNSAEVGCGAPAVHEPHHSDEVAGRHPSDDIQYCGGTVPPTEYGAGESSFTVRVGLGQTAVGVTVYRCGGLQWQPITPDEVKQAMQAAIGAAQHNQPLVAPSQVSKFADLAQ